MGDYSRFLIPDSGLAEGAGRIFDFADALNEYNTSPSPEEADHLALLSDWAQCGDDLDAAINEYAKEFLECRNDQGA